LSPSWAVVALGKLSSKAAAIHFAIGHRLINVPNLVCSKTTLMDVIAMRKNTGTVSGEICLNGFPQERRSFLRVSGYVEQFDIQQPELTVRETVEFCARLRLDSNDPGIKNTEGKLKYACHVLKMMELTTIQNLQVGSYEEGGLTFEQRKRLAIACELAGKLHRQVSGKRTQKNFSLFRPTDHFLPVLRLVHRYAGSPSGK
jgi:ABC-type nitrate/sulfonate/bicarbonate transport system ATPase subunit